MFRSKDDARSQLLVKLQLRPMTTKSMIGHPSDKQTLMALQALEELKNEGVIEVFKGKWRLRVNDPT